MNTPAAAEHDQPTLNRLVQYFHDREFPGAAHSIHVINALKAEGLDEWIIPERETVYCQMLERHHAERMERIRQEKADKAWNERANASLNPDIRVGAAQRVLAAVGSDDELEDDPFDD